MVESGEKKCEMCITVHFTHNLTAHMFGVELRVCASILMLLFKINGEQLRSSFKGLGVSFH